MAYWIDRLALWGFIALSAYFFIMALTDGNIFLSFLFAFCIVFLIRLLTGRLSEKQWISPKKKRQCAAAFLRKWALLSEEEALADIKSTLGSAFDKHIESPIHLFQSFPDSSANLTADCLIKIWKQHSGNERLFLISTVPATESVHALCHELTRPVVHLFDGEALLNLLVRSNLDIPKKSRPSASFRTRIARFVRAVRPIRTGAYMSAFLIIYLLTRSPFYLIAALAEALLLCAHLIANRKLNHSSFS